MKIIRNLLLGISVALLTACSTVTKIESPVESNENTFAIVDVLPTEIEGFVYRGAKSYPDPWGYSLRYQFEKNHVTYADVYIYPVPKGMEGRSHEGIVAAMSNQAIEEIGYATEQGAYSEYNVIENRSFKVSARQVIRTDVLLVKNNLESYSLLFITESNAKLIKVRMTMADNESNRKNGTWQKFVESIFTTIIDNIEKA